ncbi:phosphatidyl-N-methylethanolamine N-methyltransferase isoform X4 [Macadamia integrifolia]|uniref:phosphatidyl-N-methylethanolamine N-methyltransferase isoform X4 n=1 Tax=Macadamia integrifolia TaxID=60698 RepID=UPI001C4F6A5D|nr:phosphatidyl-N-methylethanolamine N-methyltransferase isoform X4 [Macadamia integrifolia]
MNVIDCIGVLLPFPFYYWLWTYPQTWVDLCGKVRDPSKFLNFRVYQLLGESGTYYGVRFGKKIPWVTEFPFGYIQDPQYVGSIMSLLACLSWVPFLYIFLWVLGYVFMIWLESKEDPATRAKPLA